MDISEDRVVLDNRNTHTHIQALQNTDTYINKHPLHSVLERERETFYLLQTTSTTNCTTITTYCVFFCNKKNQFVFL